MSKDLIERLHALTPSRVRLDPAGGAAPLAAVLDFQACHAAARAAIHGQVDWDSIAAALDGSSFRVASRATARADYLRRPDLGRMLDPSAIVPKVQCDVALVVADGLSATAIAHHAPAMCNLLMSALKGMTIGPIALVEGGRVAIADEIGDRMGARLTIMLIGERPGLSVSDSLGAYLTFAPRAGTPDSLRNCVSNIHDKGGLDHAAAAHKIAWLVRQAMHRSLTGTALKDDSHLLG
ncbi:ethanolamine ammonia-lyase subunit EutC [Falsirhodobacter sp. alg1]|uniref:ethanolamine ammonia-lyase subunit EutC n=1 Tax=Falsirhodobacter sp. alg1 TaxID=1472418 RepID=UPI000789826A|nr:ethanolamine ammonia-lyase subunit EutC [Falsirhodobacter sp. alg1]